MATGTINKVFIVEKQEITVSGLGFNGTKKETQLTLPTVRSGYTAYMINALPNLSDTTHYISTYTNPNAQGKFYITHNLASTVSSVTAYILWVKTN